MPDYSFLMGAKPAEIPGPLDLAGKGLTLGNLANQLQMGQLGLQQAQQMADYYTRALAPGGGASSPAGPFGIDMAALQANPLAASKIIPQSLEFQKTMAMTAKDQADALKASGETQVFKLNQAQKFASGLGDNPTPQQANALASWVMDSGTDPRRFDTNSPRAFVSSVATTLQDPKVRQDIAASKIDTAIKQVGHLETLPNGQSVLIRPPVFDQDGNPTTGWQIGQPNTTPPAAVPAAAAPPVTVPAPAPAGYTQQTTDDGIPVMAAPGQQFGNNGAGFAPALQAHIAGLVSSLAGGAGGGAAPAAPLPQMKLTAEQAKLGTDAATEIAKQQPTIQAASELQQGILRLRDTDARGIYNGPVGASKFWKDLTGTFAPYMSPEDAATVNNSQEFNAQAGTILAKYAQQIMGGRMSRGALMLMQPTKPSDVMQPGARANLYKDIYNASQRTQDYWNQAGDFVSSPDNTGKGLGQFKPEYAPDIGALPVTPGAVTWSPQQAAMLKSFPDRARAIGDFDAKFGAGAAAQVLGQ